MQQTYVKMSFVTFAKDQVAQKGFMSLYNGLGAGITRQIFYATSRFGLFEVIRDQIGKSRTIGVPERVAAGLVSGACAALLSCPAEVRAPSTLVHVYMLKAAATPLFPMLLTPLNTRMRESECALCSALCNYFFVCLYMRTCVHVCLSVCLSV
jgi:hypothetical protein